MAGPEDSIETNALDFGGSFVRRFEAKIARAGEDDCWLWRGARIPTGHGQVRFGMRVLRASRVAYALAYGKVQSGMVIRHTCDNPPCVNPKHLLVGTMADNNRDKAERGRAVAGYGNSKLSFEAAEHIRALRAKGVSSAELAVTFGVSQSTVCNIVSGKTWATALTRQR